MSSPQTEIGDTASLLAQRDEAISELARIRHAIAVMPGPYLNQDSVLKLFKPLSWWVTYAHQWGPGKVHAADCRHADGNLATGHWVLPEHLPPQSILPDCKVCGGRKSLRRSPGT